MIGSRVLCLEMLLILAAASIGMALSICRDGVESGTQIFVICFVVVSLGVYAFLSFRERRGKVLLYTVLFLGMQVLSGFIAYWMIAPRYGENLMNYTVGQRLNCMMLT